MIWQDYFPKVIIPNLPERTDRLERITKLLWDYGIEATIWEATKHTDGRLGLVITMQGIFRWCLQEGYERVFIMEDDCEILVSAGEFHITMDNCCEDLSKIQWDCFYAGVQHPKAFTGWRTPNLLNVTNGYSTHATGYSKKAMEFVVGNPIQEPLDNFLARELHKQGTSFCSYPLLCSQYAGYSDIDKDHKDWGIIIKKTFQESTISILHNRFKQNV